MATEDKKLKTWQQKLQAGEVLSPLEEVKADADFNFKQRLREHRERQAFEQRKLQTRPAATPAPAQAPAESNEKKGE